MDNLTVGELWRLLGIADFMPATLYGFTLVMLGVLLLPVWIALLRGKLLIMFAVAWKALWGIGLTSTLLLAPIGIPRYYYAWRLALA